LLLSLRALISHDFLQPFFFNAKMVLIAQMQKQKQNMVTTSALVWLAFQRDTRTTQVTN
jgi:hypothetical protein